MRGQGENHLKYNIILLISSLLTFEVFAQRCFTSVEEAKEWGECVECLDLSKQGLRALPMELCEFPNLKRLILSRNRLSGDMEELKCLKELHYLDLSSNYIESLSESLAELKLDTLIMWDNPCYAFAEEFSKMPLLYLDMRAIQMTRSEQKKIKELFPLAKIRMGHPCNCGARRVEE